MTQLKTLPARQVKFEEVKGYASYENAQKQGEKILGGMSYKVRWIVIALPNGRFAPCVIANQEAMLEINIPYIASKNICIIN